jgi:hypothetical protein
MIKLIIIVVSTLVISACGGGTECPDTVTRTKIATDEGTNYIVCSSFQCPGFAKETRCRVE